MRRGEMRAMLLTAARTQGAGALLCVRPNGDTTPAELDAFVRGALTGWAEYLRYETTDVHGNIYIRVRAIPPTLQ
ncbi:hypothetical protein [Escherichia phage vB_EcoP_IUE]